MENIDLSDNEGAAGGHRSPPQYEPTYTPSADYNPSQNYPAVLQPPPERDSLSLTISGSSTIHPTTIPSNPIYYLPTSLSTHAPSINISKWTPSIQTNRDRSMLHANILYTITKVPTTDTYTFTPHAREGTKGQISWVSGWIWGGHWETEYTFFDEALDRERKVVLKNAGGEDGCWYLLPEVLPLTAAAAADGVSSGSVASAGGSAGAAAAEGPGIMVAEEKVLTPKRKPVKEGEQADAVGEFDPPPEGGETILIYTGKEEVTREMQEIITVAWVAKCWHERTKLGWMGNAGAMGFMYRW
ncbi:hypothetical protein DFH27DRAFT_578558 [Peziza echinospora]|nr:hypothetical protein DFH27DRAFT_578558 [Peziza echinospora]